MNKITTFWEDTAKVWLHEMRDMFKDEGALLFVILLPLASEHHYLVDDEEVAHGE